MSCILNVQSIHLAHAFCFTRIVCVISLDKRVQIVSSVCPTSQLKVWKLNNLNERNALTGL